MVIYGIGLGLPMVIDGYRWLPIATNLKDTPLCVFRAARSHLPIARISWKRRHHVASSV